MLVIQIKMFDTGILKNNSTVEVQYNTVQYNSTVFLEKSHRYFGIL